MPDIRLFYTPPNHQRGEVAQACVATANLGPNGRLQVELRLDRLKPFIERGTGERCQKHEDCRQNSDMGTACGDREPMTTMALVEVPTSPHGGGLVPRHGNASSEAWDAVPFAVRNAVIKACVSDRNSVDHLIEAIAALSKAALDQP